MVRVTRSSRTVVRSHEIPGVLARPGCARRGAWTDRSMLIGGGGVDG